MSENKSCFLVECRTGCSCCADENHYRGPFTTREVAESAVSRFREVKLLASQFASNGSYRVSERQLEVLPDGRMIVDDERVVRTGFVDEAPLSDEAVYERHGF